MTTIEQLNSSQWHAVSEDPRGHIGVGNYVHVLAMALVKSALHGGGIETVDLTGYRLTMVRDTAGAVQ